MSAFSFSKWSGADVQLQIGFYCRLFSLSVCSRRDHSINLLATQSQLQLLVSLVATFKHTHSFLTAISECHCSRGDHFCILCFGNIVWMHPWQSKYPKVRSAAVPVDLDLYLELSFISKLSFQCRQFPFTVSAHQYRDLVMFGPFANCSILLNCLSH